MRLASAVLLVAAGLAVSASAAAQSAVGVRAGMRWAEVEATPPATGLDALVVAGYFGFGVANNLAIQIEGVYGKRGATRLRVGTDALDADAAPVAVEMSYIEVPLLLRAGFPRQRILPSFFFGPYVGFLLNCDITPEGGAARSCDDPVDPQRFGPRHTDYGLVFGGGLDVAVGNGTVFLDARYSLGLLSIEAGENPFDARHTGLAVSGGFAVPLGR